MFPWLFFLWTLMLNTSLVDRCCSWTLYWFLACCCEKCMNTGGLQREVYLGLWPQTRDYNGKKDMAAGSHSRKLREHIFTHMQEVEKKLEVRKCYKVSKLPVMHFLQQGYNHKGSIASPKQHHQGSNTWAIRNIFHSNHHRIFMESSYSP